MKAAGPVSPVAFLCILGVNITLNQGGISILVTDTTGQIGREARSIQQF